MQKLEVFCTVVELDGVGRAAEHLFLTQPVVTAHLRTLGRQLGAPLFEREGRGLKLTEAGERAYRWAREALARGAELQRDLDGLVDGSQGSAIVAAGMAAGTYMLPPILGRFCQEFPDAAVALEVLNPEQTEDAVRTGACDFAVMFTPFTTSGAGFVVDQLGFEEVIVVAAADGPPLADRVTPEALAAVRFVSSPRDHARRTLIDATAVAAGLELGPVSIELGHPEAEKRAVREGLGVALLPRSAVADELRSGQLRVIEVEGVRMMVPVYLLRLAGRQLSSLQQALYDELRGGLVEVLEPVADG